jgi:hypothetical protein
MAFPRLTSGVSKLDFVDTLLRQKNACPICGMPLVWNENSDDEPNHYSDNVWGNIRRKMQEGWGISGRSAMPSDVFGVETGNRPNVQYCHYVASTYMPEITRPKLYQGTTLSNMLREGKYYLHKDVARQPLHCLFEWEMNRLIQSTPQDMDRRLARFHSFFSVTGINFFLGCSDCNKMHTGHQSVTDMVNEMYPGTQNDVGVYNMYTLVYDSMSGGQNFIGIDDIRAKTWHVELWITYCAIMFLAQNRRSRLSTVDDPWYRMHYAPRDMGICDFYMSQILCALLYINYDIEVDFIWLHQNFMARLPQWARDVGKRADGSPLFVTPKPSYLSLWRMVMGTRADGFEDLALNTGKDAYQFTGNLDSYYFAISSARSLSQAAGEIKTKIYEFMPWLQKIGEGINRTTVRNNGMSLTNEITRGLHRMFMDSYTNYDLLNDLVAKTLDNDVTSFSHVTRRQTMISFEDCYVNEFDYGVTFERFMYPSLQTVYERINLVREFPTITGVVNACFRQMFQPPYVVDVESSAGSDAASSTGSGAPSSSSGAPSTAAPSTAAPSTAGLRRSARIAAATTRIAVLPPVVEDRSNDAEDDADED